MDNFGHGLAIDGNSSSTSTNQTIILGDVQWPVFMTMNVNFTCFGTTIAGMEKWITLDHYFPLQLIIRKCSLKKASILLDLFLLSFKIEMGIRDLQVLGLCTMCIGDKEYTGQAMIPILMELDVLEDVF